MTLSFIPSPSTELTYSVLSSEEKLLLYQEIYSHRWKGTPMVILGSIVLFVSSALLLIGSLLLGYPIEAFSLLHDIILPFLLPAILGIVGIAIPLFFFASLHHAMAVKKHKQLAESNYMQVLKYCHEKQQKVTKQVLADFIETHVVIPQYTRQFSYITLSKTLDIVSEIEPSQSSPYDEDISKGIEYTISGIFMSKYEREKRRQKENKKELQQLSKNTTIQ
ncbi:hypothetical protein BOKEGFJH_00357 [Chlamydia avium]|uniref:Uncharacterized protein n=2 Tax=Chlamydia avium TaxID=1457141 RepID=W8JLU0_9CHLA|nr:hypothetical protein [Chlamydia avium]AHK63239.1 Uncharacterized protein M832_03740 [Chlamydia avium 10DC88]EPP36659.1 hypothetical protein CP10743SC13_0698 [Chlamydia psittaci 10_743_SC13]EPP38366.1 hypothetical protein CP10881SC42_0777 [Chlamydia avium]VVT42841.1 hypothetical protein BOKEGFJH_00357 [Chlamydia avium]